MLRVQQRRRSPSDDRSDWFDLILGAAVTGLITGRLAAMILGGTNPFAHPADILLIRGGVDTGWASLGALAYLAWSTRRDGLSMLDGIAPVALIGLAGWHAGCLFRSACLGTQSDLPWALTEPGSTITRHPTELYTAALFLLVGIGLLVLSHRINRTGLVFGLGLAAAATIRWATDAIRPTLGSGPVLWYLAGITIGLLVASASSAPRESTELEI